MFSQIKDRKHIEQNFHSVAKVMPRDGLGVLGESKTLAWGFAMAQHRLCALVYSWFCYERFSMMSRPNDRQADINTTSQYLDDILNINTTYFGNKVSQI